MSNPGSHGNYLPGALFNGSRIQSGVGHDRRVENNSTTTGAYDFANLTTDNIERIEVLRSLVELFTALQAIGGVINIITKRV